MELKMTLDFRLWGLPYLLRDGIAGVPHACFFFLKCISGDQNQSFMHGRQTFDQLSNTPGLVLWFKITNVTNRETIVKTGIKPQVFVSAKERKKPLGVATSSRP